MKNKFIQKTNLVITILNKWLNSMNSCARVIHVLSIVFITLSASFLLCGWRMKVSFFKIPEKNKKEVVEIIALGEPKKVPKEFFVLSDKLEIIQKTKKQSQKNVLPEFTAGDRLIVAENLEILDEKGGKTGFFVKNKEDIALLFAKKVYDRTFPLGAKGYASLSENIRNEIFFENISKCEMYELYKNYFDSYFSTSSINSINTSQVLDEATFGTYCQAQFSLPKSKSAAGKSIYQVDIDGDGKRTDVAAFGEFKYQYNEPQYGTVCNGTLLLFINNGDDNYQIGRVSQNNLCKATFYKKGEVINKKRFTSISNKQGVFIGRKEEAVPYTMPTDGFRLDSENDDYFQIAIFDGQSINQIKIIQGTEDVQKYEIVESPEIPEV